MRPRRRGEEARRYSLPSSGVPNPHAGIQTSGCYTVAIEGNRVNLAVVTLKCMQAAALRNTPDLGGSVVTARNNDIAMDLQTPHTSLMTDENISAHAVLDIPDSKGRIPGSGDGSVRVRHLKASDSGSVSTECMHADTRHMCLLAGVLVRGAGAGEGEEGKKGKRPKRIVQLTPSSSPTHEHLCHSLH